MKFWMDYYIDEIWALSYERCFGKLIFYYKMANALFFSPLKQVSLAWICIDWIYIGKKISCRNELGTICCEEIAHGKNILDGN